MPPPPVLPASRPKLVLAARWVEFDGVRVALHGFRLAGGGRDNHTLAFALGATPYVGVLAIAIPGGDVAYPAGTLASAKVTADMTIPPPSAPALTRIHEMMIKIGCSLVSTLVLLTTAAQAQPAGDATTPPAAATTPAPPPPARLRLRTPGHRR